VEIISTFRESLVYLKQEM